MSVWRMVILYFVLVTIALIVGPVSLMYQVTVTAALGILVMGFAFLVRRRGSSRTSS